MKAILIVHVYRLKKSNKFLAPVGGKGPHFHRIADAIRQGRGGIGSPSADLVEWLNGVSPTFGWLYSTAFALAGFESVM